MAETPSPQTPEETPTPAAPPSTTRTSPPTSGATPSEAFVQRLALTPFGDLDLSDEQLAKMEASGLF